MVVRQRRRLSLLSLAASALAVVLFALLLQPELSATKHDGQLTNPEDFRAFYCAGAAVGAGRDPYRTQPLWDCELAALRSNGMPLGDRHVMPAPLPPYALLLFVPFTRLPFFAASLLWAALAVLAVATAALLAARLSGLPLGLTAAIIAPAEIVTSLYLGQVVPLVICALCAAALALRHRRHGVTAALLSFAAIEPHVVLPAFLALALFAPAMRRPLTAGASLLAALSLAVAGPTVCLEYLGRVLPLHARSEVVNYGAQYSLTSLLSAFGAGDDLALRAGELCYALTLFAGVELARRLARRCEDPALLVVAPPAVVLFGGAFLHAQQMVVALPFALLLSRYVPRAAGVRAALFVAIAALTIPWQAISELPFAADRLPPAAPPRIVVLPRPRPDELAELPRTRYLEAVVARFRHTVWVDTALKLPTWIGLALLVGVALRVVQGPLARPTPSLGKARIRWAARPSKIGAQVSEDGPIRG